MSDSKPVIWLKEGHVCGFTLPLPENVEARWRAGHLIRVNEDGSTYQGAHFILPGQEDLDPAPAGEGEGAGGGPARPKKNASRPAWAAYAVELGACDEDAADKMTRDELIALVTAPEDKPPAE